MMDPEDGGYATTDEELDSDCEDAEIELDLKMWLKQLDSPTTITKNPSSRTKYSASVTSDAKSTKSEKHLDVDFDAILGELDSLDEQFSNVQCFDSPSRSSSSKPTPPVKKNDPRPPEKPRITKTSHPNERRISDDFGDINSQLQDALLELNKLVDDGSNAEKKNATEHVKDAKKKNSADTNLAQSISAVGETDQKHSASASSIRGTTHHQRERRLVESAAEPAVVRSQKVSAVTETRLQLGAACNIQGSQHPQQEKHLVENEKSFGRKLATENLVHDPVPRQSFPGGRQLTKDEGGSREDTVSVKSTDSRSSTNSVNQSVKSVQSSSRSIASENVPQVCVKVFSPDGSSKSVLADETTTVGHLCEILMEKNLVDQSLTWGVIEQMPDLFMQRQLEDHQLVLKEISGWPTQPTNRLVFLETPKKYDMFNKSKVLDEETWQATELEGWLHLKSDGKKAWKKQGFVLRNGGIYYSSKGKGKSEGPCLKLLSEVEVYTGVAWKKKFKAPTDFGIALKPGLLQKKSVQDIKYLCADDSGSMWKWVTTIRLAKHGFQLYRNFSQFILARDHDFVPPDFVPPSNTGRVENTNYHCPDLTTNALQRASDATSEQPLAPYELQKDGQMNTHRRGSADSSRNSLVSSPDVSSTSKIKAQIPITAQTARLLSMQQPSVVQTLPRNMSRGREPQNQPLNGHQGLSVTPAREMPQQPGRPENYAGFRPPSPDLPPPPPEFLASPLDSSPPAFPSFATLRNPTTRKQEPPPPPRRNQSTKLSFHGRSSSSVVQTKNFILNLQRTIGQKQQHGAKGISQLEMPLPPPPVYSDDPSYLDLGELPPPPAELLEELKVMKRKSRKPPPTLAKQSTHRSTKLQ